MAASQCKRSAKSKGREPTGSLSRRGFLKGIAVGAGVLVVAGGAGTVGLRLASGSAYCPRFLTRGQFETLEAACERILPADDDSGAKALGAAIYIDRLLAEDSYTGDFLKYRSTLAKGLDNLEGASRRKHGRRFAQLDSKRQDALLGEQPDAQFLATLVSVTLDGVLYDPFYGGNRDGMGWRIIEFSPRSSFRSKGLPLADGATTRS